MSMPLISNHPPRPGDPAPDVSFTDDAGRRRQLAELRGTPVVLAFDSAPWDPARAECVAAYNRALSQLGADRSPRLVSITGDGPWRELRFEQDAIAMPVLDAATVDVADAAARYGVSARAAVFVIDAEGVVRWRFDSSSATLPPWEAIVQALSGDSDEDEPAGDAIDVEEPATVEAEMSSPRGWSRRDFVATVLGAAIAAALAPVAARAESLARMGDAATRGAAMPVTLRVNGKDLSLTLEPRVTLLDALREYAGLTGTKKGCDHGQCGACTVQVDGKRTLSCLTLAAMQQGKSITTIEGLATGDELHPMQRAFIEHDGFQCGYCTSGQIMSAVAVTAEPWGPSDDDVREAMSGNICRCGAYVGIVAAVQSVRQRGSGNNATPQR